MKIFVWDFYYKKYKKDFDILGKDLDIIILNSDHFYKLMYKFDDFRIVTKGMVEEYLEIFGDYIIDKKDII